MADLWKILRTGINVIYVSTYVLVDVVVHTKLHGSPSATFILKF